jgi:hypothetical protein
MQLCAGLWRWPVWAIPRAWEDVQASPAKLLDVRLGHQRRLVHLNPICDFGEAGCRIGVMTDKTRSEHKRSAFGCIATS